MKQENVVPLFESGDVGFSFLVNVFLMCPFVVLWWSFFPFGFFEFIVTFYANKGNLLKKFF